jgi:hypothetical protein
VIKPVTRLQNPEETMSAPCTTVELSDVELRLLHNALETYLSDFGHEDHELIVAARRLITRLDEAGKSVGTTKVGG